jgi:mannosyltransferase
MTRPDSPDALRDPEVLVTNFNTRFTGVSSTALAVLREHLPRYRCALVGVPLPGLPAPLSRAEALRLSRRPPADRPFRIWHTRRNTEMTLALFARDVLRLPIRIVFTSAAKHVHSAWPRFLISRMDRIIATSDDAAACVGRHEAVIPHGVDTDKFRPAGDRAAAWRATGYPGAYGIANVGRVRPDKGSDIFVEAMIRALPHLPGATALVIGLAKPGDAAFVEGLKARIAAAGLSERILFTGALDHDRLAQVLPGCRLLCAVPRYEPYGVTPIEGMAAGLPIVASATGHFAAMAGDEGAPDQCGRIVPLEDAAATAEAVLWALGDEARFATLSASARDRAERLFSIRGEAAGVAAVYEELWRKG